MLTATEQNRFDETLPWWGFKQIEIPEDGVLMPGVPESTIYPHLGIRFFHFNETFHCTKVFPPILHEKIACSAIRIGENKYTPVELGYTYRTGEIFIGTIPCRHFHLLWVRNYFNKARVPEPTMQQGFFTTYGRFVDRSEAGLIATKRGQLLDTTIENTYLFSEDVWNTPALKTIEVQRVTGPIPVEILKLLKEQK